MELLSDTVEDRRAPLRHEPRSIYGKLVSSADRNSDVDEMKSQVFDYTKHLHPEMTEDEIIEEARIHLREKYSPNGYAAQTMYFDDPDFTGVLTEVEKITRDFETFAKAIRENNARRMTEKLASETSS